MQARQIDDESPAGPPPSLRIVVAPNPRHAALVRHQFAEFARQRAVPETDVAPFVIALGEALANAVEHARTAREIVATCSLDGDRLVATVVDAGIGFAPAERPCWEAQTPEPTAERGRGFAIMRHCTDRLAVRSVPGEGTAVTLVRYIRPHRTGGRRTAVNSG